MTDERNTKTLELLKLTLSFLLERDFLIGVFYGIGIFTLIYVVGIFF